MPNFVDASLAGENSFDFFGRSLAMSSDGSRFIVGAYGFDGTAGADTGKIYSCSYSGGNIVIDSTYEGQSSERLGFSVALNSAGNRYVACGFDTIRIGSVAEDGTLTPTYSGTHGLVEDGANTQIYDCALSADGTILATTQPFFDSDGLNNDGQLRFYTIASDGTNLTFDASVVSDIDGFEPYAIALNDVGDRFIWGGVSTDDIILGTFNGSTITKSLTITRTGRMGATVALNAAGDRFVAGAPGLNSFYGGFYTGTFNGVSGEIDGSFTYQASAANIGDSIAISDAGDRFIVGGENNAPTNDEGLILMGTISDVGVIAVDTSYVGEYTDYFLGQYLASDSYATTFISSGSSTFSSKGTIYYVAPPPDTDGDGIGDPTDIFLNQQLNVVPTAIPQLANVFAIAPGKHHTLAILRDGRVLSFGRNQSGQLGRLVTDVSGHVPADVSGASNGYAVVRAGARLEGGDAYKRSDVIGSAEKNRALLSILRLLRSSLEGESGFNAGLADHYLANLSREYA